MGAQIPLTTGAHGATTAGAKLKLFLRGLFARQETGIIVVFVVLLAFFYMRNSAMLNPTTVASLLRTLALPALISMGMVQLMIAGEIDLSIAAVMSLCAVFAAKLIRDVGLTIPEAVVCALGVACLVGLVNAVLTIKVGIPAVIATIGTAFMVRGLSYSFTNGLPIYPLPEAVGYIGSLRPFNVSFAFFFMLALAVVVQILLDGTRWGSMLFATGANKVAAQITGINTDRVKTICFVLTSVLAGCAGLLSMSQLPGTPGDPVIGRGVELSVLAGVIIGGVSFYGGRGSAIGSLFGVAFIQLVQSGLVIAHFDPYLQTPAVGLLLMIAVAMDVIRHQRSKG